MNFLNLINQIDEEQLDAETRDKFLGRKEALTKMGNFSKKLALSALPLGAISAFATPQAQAQSTEDLVSVLNYALTLEYLEAEFYQTGIDEMVINSDDLPVFEQINQHEQAHVAFLQNVISNVLMGEPVDKPTFDFTVGGTFSPFSNYAQFLALSQAFEDTGVRAYKGQAGNVQGNATVLTAALQIHSVEARHAAVVRKIRGLNGWITQDQRGDTMPEATQAVYNGEANTTQLGVDVTTVTEEGADDITEAWDEILTQDEVLGIASLFIES